MSSLARLSGEVLGSRSNPGIPDPLPASVVSASHVLAPAMAVHTSSDDSDLVLSVPMSIQSELGDLQRLEETIRKAVGDVIMRLDESNRRCDQAARRLSESNRRCARADRWFDESNRRRDQLDRMCDPTLKELWNDFVSLKNQQSVLIAKVTADNGGDSSPTSTGSNERARGYADLRIGPTDSLVTDLHSSGTCTVAAAEASDSAMEFAAETELRSLKQLGMVSDYLTQFKALLDKVKISESYAVHLFVRGLNYHIQKSVRMFRPRLLVHAFALARLQESCVNFRGNYDANTEGNEEMLIEEAEMEMVMISKGRDLPTVCGYENVEVLEEGWIGMINKEIGVNLMEKESSIDDRFK